MLSIPKKYGTIVPNIKFHLFMLHRLQLMAQVSLGYKDDESIIEKLKPLNPYGISKNEFDKWALRQVHDDILQPPAWAGLKFFNVYGPNEYHKARMASVIFHSYNQIVKNGFVKLFKSHKKEFNDGEQLRDFIYVKDVLNICFWFLECWQNDTQFFCYRDI